MEQHAIPRQVTSFEFKLIGFMTLKQFGFLLMFVLMAIAAYFIVPILIPLPLINVLSALVIGGAGAAIAFMPIQDRPLDVWISNLIKRLRSPTQYVYHKNNASSTLYFLHDLYYAEDPHVTMAHIESKEMLSSYLDSKKKEQQAEDNQRRQDINALLQHPTHKLKSKNSNIPMPTIQSGVSPTSASASAGQTVVATVSSPGQSPSSPQSPYVSQIGGEDHAVAMGSMAHPFFTGIVKNNRRIPLPGILVYVKDNQGKPVRILKTNPHGVFATYSPLPPGEYLMEIKDPNGGHFFDTMNIRIDISNPQPFEFFSRELL